MTSRLPGAIALLFLLFSSEVAAAQDLASQIVGVWKLKAYERKYVESGETAKPYGDNPDGVSTFSRGGHFTLTMHAGGRKALAVAQPTDAELATLFRAAFFGSGTYKVEGDKVILRYDSSSGPSFIGEERRITVATAGKVLTWMSPTFKDESGKAFSNIFTYDRLE